MSEEVNEIMNNDGPVEEESTSEVVVEEVPAGEESEESEGEEEEPETEEPEAPVEEVPEEPEAPVEEAEAPVEEAEEEPEEPEEPEPPAEEEVAPEEAPAEEAAAGSEAVEEPAEEPAASGSETEAPEEPVAPPAPEPEPEPEPEVAPVEQVVSDIRDILSEEPVASVSAIEEAATEASELTDDLKQRIAELDYLRECCGNWVGSGRAGKRNFLTAWESKSVSVDANVNYEDTLVQLEKLPELVKLWGEGKIKSNSNHFKNFQSYTLEKSLFNEKSVTEKVEVLEQLIVLLTDCANGKMRVTQIKEVIDNLY